MYGKRLYNGKPYKLALNREGYYELRWTGADGKTKQRSTGTRDLGEARVEAELVWREVHRIATGPRSQLLNELSVMERLVKEIAQLRLSNFDLNEEVHRLRRRVAELEGGSSDVAQIHSQPHPLN
jgi:hypothetical protein